MQNTLQSMPEKKGLSLKDTAKPDGMKSVRLDPRCHLWLNSILLLRRQGWFEMPLRSLNSVKFGAVAQLGARLNGIQEVKGSNPFSSIPLQDFLGKSLDK